MKVIVEVNAKDIRSANIITDKLGDVLKELGVNENDITIGLEG